MKEQLKLAGFGQPLEIRYEKGFSCLVYSGESNSTLETIRADLKNRRLRPLGPKETLVEVVHHYLEASDVPNLKKVVESRPILIANDVDVHMPGVVFVSGGDALTEKRKRILTAIVGEYLSGEEVNPYLLTKYGHGGIVLLNRLHSEKGRLNKFPPAIYTPVIREGMSEDNQVMAAHALDISGDRVYFNGNFQDFSSCCVFGKKK